MIIKGEPLGPKSRDRLVELANTIGIMTVADECGLSTATLGRAIGGLRVYGCTRMAIQAYLERRLGL